jgi:hypothetical protein
MVKSGTIYKLVSDDIEITECYVGSTCNFRIRKSQHKSNCNNEKCKSYNLDVYQFIRDNGGWGCWSMIQIEEFKFDIRKELHTRERHWVETLHATLNKVVPTRTDKEYYRDNSEDIKQKAKTYQLNNIEQVKTTKQEYYRRNRLVINNERKKKSLCICGGHYSYNNLVQHSKSTKHMVYIALN